MRASRRQRTSCIRRKWGPTLFCNFVVSLVGLVFASSAAATELRLCFKDEEGQPVELYKVELLLVAWGVADRVELAEGLSL